MQNVKSLITTRSITIDKLKKYIKMANFFYDSSKINNNRYLQKYPGHILGLVFYEPSTRTMASFHAAMSRLGGTSIVIQPETSSVKKGETLEDTIRTMGIYTDAIVLRHFDKNSSELAATVTDKAVINGGDGNGEHPTQALLDIYTIYRELGKRVFTETIKVLFVGDLKNSRTIHSLIYLLELFPNIQYIFLSPEKLQMPDEIKLELKNPSRVCTSYCSEIIEEADVIYMTRIQKERFNNNFEYYEVLKENFVLDETKMARAKPKVIVMHPLPRGDEISKEVDKDSRAVYFKQMEYGVYMRMAIIDDILSK
jgi:carbamoyl-phosphate synthase/aspartate carbamoyltransferase